MDKNKLKATLIALFMEQIELMSNAELAKLTEGAYEDIACKFCINDSGCTDTTPDKCIRGITAYLDKTD